MAGARLRRLSMAALTLVIVVQQADPAAAGASWIRPVHDRYEPGEVVTLVGYTGGGAFGWVEDGPFFGYLIEAEEDGAPAVGGVRMELGELSVAETERGGYLSLRASISFTLPVDIAPGVYHFDYCNAACNERLGDLLGGAVYVGVDPEFPISREWPLDDPEIVNLEPDALLLGPGFEVSAGEVIAGEVDFDPLTGLPDMRPQPTVTEPPASFATTSRRSSDVPVQPTPGVEKAVLSVARTTANTGSDSPPWLLLLAGAVLLGIGASAGAVMIRRRNTARSG